MTRGEFKNFMNKPFVQSVVVAGLSGGSGKSVASVGLVAALIKTGNRVVPFKKGPDYIDAGWMTAAAGNPCYNLDPYLMSKETIKETFQHHIHDFDFAVVEGNRGLYDGVNAEGGYSTAELALQLDLPVILVVNCAKTTRTVAAMVLGCRELDRRVRLAGVLLNQIATPRHESIVRCAVEEYTGISVLGIIPRLAEDVFPMRHLGVTPHQEFEEAAGVVDKLGEMAAKHFDLDRIIDVMEPVAVEATTLSVPRSVTGRVTIGVIRDMAFQFYYQENLDALEAGGAELVMIDALESTGLPDNLGALYIGGGFPETSAGELAANSRFRASVRHAAEAGLPIYAECGGLIFLGHSIILEGVEYPLVDLFPVTFTLDKKPQAHGYSVFIVEGTNSFYPRGTRIKGHEFRYSVVDQWQGNSADLVLEMERGTGFYEKRDGLVKNNVLAMYTHVLASGTPEWASGVLRAAHRFSQH